MAKKKLARTAAATANTRAEGWNECLAQLARSTQQLERSLRSNETKLPLKRRLEWEKALVAMKMASHLVGDIPCAQPFMSFDFPFLAKHKPQQRAASRRRR
jgi:hypothetical protein